MPEHRIVGSGHGWVFPNPNGVKARCGGPRICPECQKDKALWIKLASTDYDAAQEMLVRTKGDLQDYSTATFHIAQ